VRYEPPAPVSDDIGAIWSKYLKGNHGQIAFGYGAEQHRFGQYVDGPEARDIADMLNAALAADPDAGTLALAAYQAGMAARNQPSGATDLVHRCGILEARGSHVARTTLDHTGGSD